jgi:hypothetical protein
VFFTSVPSEVIGDVLSFPCVAKLFIVGTSTDEMDNFFSSQYPLLSTMINLHPSFLNFAAMQCQHSAVKYLVTKLGLLGFPTLSLIRTLNGKNSEHAFALCNLLIKAIPLGSAPKLREVRRIHTVSLKVESDSDFEKVLHVYEIVLRTPNVQATSPAQYSLRGDTVLPISMNFDFYQVCLPKEVFIERPHLKTVLVGLSSIGMPVSFLGPQPEMNKEFYCFAVSIEGLAAEQYTYLLDEIHNAVQYCVQKLQLFAYDFLQLRKVV